MRRVTAVAVLALSGCAGAPVSPPAPSVVAAAPSSKGPLNHNTLGISDAAPPAHWWRLYMDGRLDGYVVEALGANADLRVASANLARARAVVDEARAARDISTAISGGAETSQIGDFTKPLPGTPYAYTIGLALSYPLDIGGGIKRAIDAASDDADAVLAARDQVRVAIVAGVTRSYLAACSANVSLAAAKRVLATQERTLDAADRLRRGGRGTAFDVTRARAPFDQSQAEIPGILAERRAALLELGALMGRSPIDYPREAESCASPPTFRQALPVGDGTGLLARRPDIRAADRRLAAAIARVGVERALLYPQVRLGGSIGSAGPLAAFGQGGTFGGSIGPFVSWAFPNRPAIRARIAEAGAAADAAAASFDANVISALRQVETAISAYGAELQRNASLVRSVRDARTAETQANRLFTFGRTGFLDVLTSQNQLAAAEAALAQSDAALTARRVDVFMSLGGGWEDAGAAASIPPRTVIGSR